jgi:hypothetical protein
MNLKFEECDCMCHQPGISMMHFMPCCITCDYCGKNINFNQYKEHLEKCEKEYNIINENKTGELK